MLLENKNAAIFGAGGAIGGAVAKAFAREGARVFLSGRRPASVGKVAKDIAAAGGVAETAVVDALDEDAVERYVAGIAEKAGGIDVVLNGINCKPLPLSKPLTEISYAEFNEPIAAWTKAQFLSARAAARHMIKKRSGVVLTLSASPARLAIGMTGGFAVACSAIEGMSRTLAAELGPHGVRVVCLRPHRIADAMPAESDMPMPMADFVAFLLNMTLLKKLPTLADVANTAVFLASDHAAAMTGTVANLTCGTSVD